jgi:tetratricopeptide (TPR) repeat protein
VGHSNHPSHRKRTTGGRVLLTAPGALAAVATLATLVRLAHFIAFRRTPLAAAPILDAQLYDAWARRIAAGDWLGKGEGVFYANPLYPYFLGIIYRVSGGSEDAARIVQHALGAGTAVLITAFTQRAFGVGAGLTAGVLAALYGPFVLYEDLLLTETLVVFLAAAAIALCMWAVVGAGGAGVRAVKPPPSAQRFLLAGAALGLGLLARPTLLPIAGLAWIATATRRGALIAALGIAITILPVTARNWLIGGTPVLITAHGGETFYVGNRTGADGANLQPDFVRSGPLTEHEDYRREASRRLGREVDLPTSSAYWRNQALSDIARDPGGWLRLEARKLSFLVQDYEKGDNIDLDTVRDLIPIQIQALTFSRYGLVLALAVLGIVAGWNRVIRIKHPAGLLVLSALAFAAGCLIIFVTGRYRLPLVVPLLAFAGFGAASLAATATAAARSRSRGTVVRSLVAAAAFVLLLLGAHRPHPAPDRDDPAIAQVNLGFLRERAGDLEGAVTAYRQAIALRPNFPLAHFNLGVAERLRGNLAAAATALERATALDPSYAEAFDQLAMTKEQTGDLDSALTLYQRAIALDPERPRFYRDLGRLHVLRREPEPAARAWERAVALDPADSTTAQRLTELRRWMASAGSEKP